ncbi:PAS domain-containing sensor histidine kinase [Granulicella sp. dw_53]|uniref:PAS domain-containing sensor histidine kinase n=1 Tax=Granulicella sp. dw_53 TaxID=2719792 RepID=UPI001BD28472|nr:PAS domain-containing sensor histidine kinase [Granulicella sp. dw_53]
MSKEISEHPHLLLAAIVDSCDDAIMSKTLNGILTSWNKAATRIFGYEAHEMIGQSILRLIPAELRDEETGILSRIKMGEKIDHYETVRLTKNGDRLNVSLTVSPIRDDSGRIIGASKIARDISERRRNEEARSRLAAIVESSEDAITSMTLDGIITSWNRSACRMFGYLAEEMIGQSILRLIPEDLHAEEMEILQRLRAGERIDHYETRRMGKDGGMIEVSLTISPIRDREGTVIGSSKVAHDISVRKQMELALIQSEKLAATGRMAATIAHEINNPLESIVNLIFLARMGCGEDSEAMDYLRTAEKEIERVSHIARRTLGFYRDTGTPAEICLHELVDDVLAVNQSKMTNRGITVERRFGYRMPIVASKGELLQVLSNVIANSIDAMPKGGPLCIQILEGPLGVRVVIRDHGTGIKPENVARIFEPFFTTKGNLGTGIGLWVAKQLVGKRGGQIEVIGGTDAEDPGATVVIDLPLTSL